MRRPLLSDVGTPAYKVSLARLRALMGEDSIHEYAAANAFRDGLSRALAGGYDSDPRVRRLVDDVGYSASEPRPIYSVIAGLLPLPKEVQSAFAD